MNDVMVHSWYSIGSSRHSLDDAADPVVDFDSIVVGLDYPAAVGVGVAAGQDIDLDSDSEVVASERISWVALARPSLCTGSEDVAAGMAVEHIVAGRTVVAHIEAEHTDRTVVDGMLSGLLDLHTSVGPVLGPAAAAAVVAKQSQLVPCDLTRRRACSSSLVLGLL